MCADLRVHCTIGRKYVCIETGVGYIERETELDFFDDDDRRFKNFSSFWVLSKTFSLFRNKSYRSCFTSFWCQYTKSTASKKGFRLMSSDSGKEDGKKYDGSLPPISVVTLEREASEIWFQSLYNHYLSIKKVNSTHSKVIYTLVPVN